MGADDNAAFIYNGVLYGFEIVDNGFAGSYSGPNYNSILDTEFRYQMDSTIRQDKIFCIEPW